MRATLLILGAAGLLGAVGFALLYALGRADHLLLRLVACVVTLDHASLLLLLLLPGVRVPTAVLLLRITGPLVVAIGLGAVVESVRGGTSLLAPYQTWFGALLIALGGLTVVYLARDGRSPSTHPEGNSG